MRVRISLLLVTLLSSCLPTEDGSEPSSPRLSISSAAAIVVDVPISTTPPPLPRYPEAWTPTSSVTWPSDATRLQVIIRRGHAATSTTPATFFAFIVSDGNRLRRALLVPASDYSSFVAHLYLVFTAAETPGSSRSHSIAGGLYVGPHPAGPPGDPFPNAYLEHILSAAGSIDQAARIAVEYPL
jgi:hypothetical protein